MSIVRCLHSVWDCLATVCAIMLCTWQALWSSIDHIEGVTMVLLFSVFSNSVQLLETKVVVIWSNLIANYNYTRTKNLHYHCNYSKICN